MGDTGSLALGGAIATVAVLMKMEFLLVIIGGVSEKTDEDGKKTEEKKVDSEITLKSYVNESVDSAVKDLKQKGLVPVVIGKGDRGWN